MIDGHNTDNLPNFRALNQAWIDDIKPVLIDGFYVGQVGALRWIAHTAWKLHTFAMRMSYKIEREAKDIAPNRLPRKVMLWQK